MNLCKFIAFHMPHKEAGGRTGNKPYEELCEKAQYVRVVSRSHKASFSNMHHIYIG